MDFNQALKSILFPVLQTYGFHVHEESTQSVIFNRQEFFIYASFDRFISKDFSLSIYFDIEKGRSFYIEDCDLVEILGFRPRQKDVLLEKSIVIKFALLYAELFKLHGAILFTKAGITEVWEKTPLKIIVRNDR